MNFVNNKALLSLISNIHTITNANNFSYLSEFLYLYHEPVFSNGII
jgi:hypothetical protein